MARFASIDMGSNASRLTIVDARAPDHVEELSYIRVPVRLGHSVFLTGQLDPKMIDFAVVTLRKFAEAIEDAQVERYRAVVTASAREADNGAELVRRARSEAGIVLDSIDGIEEARLVRLAVQRRIRFGSARALLMDLGGGSLELTEIEDGKQGFSTSLEIGTVRLLESFLKNGEPVKKEQEKLLVEYLERMLGPVWSELGRKPYDVVCGTGGNFEAIAALAPSRRKGPLKAIDVARASALLPRIAKLSATERRVAYDLRADRADVIVPALYVLRAVALAARVSEVIAPGVGLKDGIVAELIDKHFRVWDYRREEDNVVQSAINLGRRYHFDEKHALQVARLAGDLFDALEPLHKLGLKERMLLRVAALLHDVGDFVHFASHHKHSQYIIEHSDLMGLSPESRNVIGCVARYHRRALPSTKHLSFSKLSPADRVLVRKLSAVLRLADALDREHRSKVRTVKAEIGRAQVTLHVKGEGDLSLEVWTAERKAGAFQQTYRKPLRIVV